MKRVWGLKNHTASERKLVYHAVTIVWPLSRSRVATHCTTVALRFRCGTSEPKSSIAVPQRLCEGCMRNGLAGNDDPTAVDGEGAVEGKQAQQRGAVSSVCTVNCYLG